MKILLVHEFYAQPGGEDQVFLREGELLRAHGHQTVQFVRRNQEIANYGWVDRLTLGPRTVWAWDAHRELRELLRREKPELAHFHNTFPLISPAAYYACRDAGVPVVQSVHNYRLACPAATLFRQGAPCEDCLKGGLWPAIRHRCYRGSRSASLAVAAMISVHRQLDTWNSLVDCYVALSSFACEKLIESGLSARKIVVKPNFVSPDPGPGAGTGNFALYMGRLAPEKGLQALLAGWKLLRDPVPLRIVGDGPLRSELEGFAAREGLSEVEFTGWLEPSEALARMKAARFLVFPSIWYETFGLAIVEAFACGVPVLASRLGAAAELVQDGRTGLSFQAGNAADLAAKVDWAWAHPDEMQGMGRQARLRFEAHYTAERNYSLLMEIYSRVLQRG